MAAAATLDAIFGSMAREASTEQLVSVGPLRVRLGYATPDLARSFDHAFAAPHSGVAAHAAEWRLDVIAGEHPLLASLAGKPAGEMQLTATDDRFVLGMGRHARTLYAVDPEKRRALYWTEHPAVIPAWERSRPFLPIFQTMIDATPWIAVHAAALARGGKAVLLTGPGRAGKTSLALAALVAGWSYVGDDYVLLRTDDAPAVAPLYATARLREDMAARFPELVEARREVSSDMGDLRHEISLGQLASTAGGGSLAEIVMIARHGAAAPTFGPVGRAALLSSLVANMTVATPGYAKRRSEKLFGLLSRFRPLSFDPGPEFGPALSALAGLLK